MAAKKTDESKEIEQLKTEFDERAKDLAAIEKDLADREKVFAANKADLDAREVFLFEREQELDRRTEEMMVCALSEADAGMSEEEQAICEEAYAAMGIAAEFVFSSSYDRDSRTVTVLTAGGKRVLLKPGERPPELTAIEISGVNPELARRKPVAGKKR